MTTRTNARLAGATFLLYIVAGITEMTLFGRAVRGTTTAAKLASIAENAATVRVTVLLTLLTFAIAVTLAVALYALTRDVDRDLSVLALCFRFAEAVLAPVAAVRTLGLLSIATAPAENVAATNALAGLLLKQGGSTATIAALCFAIGSTIFCALFLRARSIPVWLSWLGIAASVLLVFALPVQLAGALPKSLAWPVWMPMLVFELAFAGWLLIKGVRSSQWTA